MASKRKTEPSNGAPDAFEDPINITESEQDPERVEIGRTRDVDKTTGEIRDWSGAVGIADLFDRMGASAIEVQIWRRRRGEPDYAYLSTAIDPQQLTHERLAEAFGGGDYELRPRDVARRRMMPAHYIKIRIDERIAGESDRSKSGAGDALQPVIAAMERMSSQMVSLMQQQKPSGDHADKILSLMIQDREAARQEQSEANRIAAERADRLAREAADRSAEQTRLIVGLATAFAPVFAKVLEPRSAPPTDAAIIAPVLAKALEKPAPDPIMAELARRALEREPQEPIDRLVEVMGKLKALQDEAAPAEKSTVEKAIEHFSTVIGQAIGVFVAAKSGGVMPPGVRLDAIPQIPEPTETRQDPPEPAPPTQSKRVTTTDKREQRKQNARAILTQITTLHQAGRPLADLFAPVFQFTERVRPTMSPEQVAEIALQHHDDVALIEMTDQEADAFDHYEQEAILFLTGEDFESQLSPLPDDAKQWYRSLARAIADALTDDDEGGGDDEDLGDESDDVEVEGEEQPA